MKLKKYILKFLLKKKNKKTIDINKVNKILFIRNAKIGDAVCSFPLLRELSKNFPIAQIDVYAGRHSYFLFEKLPYCKNVFIKFRKRHFYKTWKQIQLMRDQKYDLIVEAMPMKFGLEFTVWYLKSKWIVSFSKGGGDQKKLGISREDLNFYDILKFAKKEQHMVDHLCSILPLLGINKYSTQMEFPYDEEKYLYAKKFISTLNKNKDLIALNVDSSSKQRSLYREQIVQIANRLNDFTIIILSLPSRREEMKNILNKEGLSNCILSFETKTIFDATELIRNCNLLVSPDTSLIHIASAIDLPTIAICNKSNIKTWGPRSTINYVVSSEVENKGDTIEGFSIEEIYNFVIDFFKKERNQSC